MDFRSRVYERAPTWLQHAAVTLYGWHRHRLRFGGIYSKELHGYLSRERFSRSEWRDYQTDRLRELLRVAVTSVPYYRTAYAAAGLDERRIARFTMDDIRDLPPLPKDAVRSRPEDFLVGGRPPARYTVCPTSGSTGTPVQIYFAPGDFQRTWALQEARECREAGVSFSLPRAVFGGRLVVPANDTRGAVYRYNAVERQVYFSAFHLSPTRAGDYVHALHRHRTVWMRGYTHCFHQLALMMLDRGLEPPSTLRAIITTSEKLTPEGRTAIRKAFKCPVFEQYGTVESVVYACEGTDGRLRISPDACILEVVDDRYRPVPAGELGRVLATGFVLKNQILIRYDLGDLAVLDPEPDPTGRHMPILKEVVGRTEDVVEGPDGRRTVRFHGLFIQLPEIREGQVVQVARDRLVIRVVPTVQLSEATVAEIRRRVHERLTDRMHVEVESVESIPRTRAGKFEAVINLTRRESLPSTRDS